jgi:hypothetical protein
VHKVDWHEFDRAKPAVDAPDKLVDSRSKVLVFFDILARWHGELHQDDLIIDHQFAKLGISKEKETLAFPIHSGCSERNTSKAWSF